MLWRPWIAALGLLVVVASGTRPSAQSGGDGVKEPAVSVGSPDARTNVATAEHPARVVPTSGPGLLSSSPALRLTLRATKADPDSPFLVQVFAKNAGGTEADRPDSLLGVVAFSSLRPGQPQEFVLAAPENGFPSIPLRNAELTVKLIPANPARSLDGASVAVEHVQFVK
jgi:hypothetical protein